ncbi:MAG: hypothetical protein IT258_14795, partial [Saprospiraceae bacterium]|nr:hypothetical protein [Saprospiraceae bacterium]
MLAAVAGMAQERPLPPGGQPTGRPPIQGIGTDSVRIGPARNSGRPPGDSQPPSGAPSTGPIVRSSNLDSIIISPDALEDQVDYSAVDSMYFDIKNKQIHLYGQAEVKMQDLTVKANYILIDWKLNEMTAEGQRLPGGEWLGRPEFTQGDQKFFSGKVRYNFKTYKGIIYDSQTNQDGLNIVGERGKFFGAGND